MAEKRPAWSNSSAVSQSKQRKYSRFQPFSDAVFLKVEEETFSVSAKILCQASPVFKAMLEGDNFKEARTREIELPSKSADDIYMMLSVLDPCPELQMGLDPKVLLPLAEEYQIMTIKEVCRKLLIASLRHDHSKVDLEQIYLSERFELTDVFNAAVHRCCLLDSIDKLADYEEYIQLLTPKTREKLMSAILKNGAKQLENVKFQGEVVASYAKDACRVLYSVEQIMCSSSSEYIFPRNSMNFSPYGSQTHTVSWNNTPEPKEIRRPTEVLGNSHTKGQYQYSVSSFSSGIKFLQARHQNKGTQPDSFTI